MIALPVGKPCAVHVRRELDNAADPPAQPDMPSTAYNVGYDGIDHPLWLSRHTGLIYTELDTVGNVRRLHADSILHAEGATGDLGGYSYSAFGKSIAPSAPGGLPDPSVSQPFRWQGKRLIAANLYLAEKVSEGIYRILDQEYDQDIEKWDVFAGC